MNTTNYPSGSPENQPPRSGFKNLIIGLLAVGVLGTAGYGLYSSNKQQAVEQTQQTQIAKVSDEKGQLQKNFDDALVRLDSLKGFNNKIQGMLSDRQNDIAKMKVEIRRILKKE